MQEHCITSLIDDLFKHTCFLYKVLVKVNLKFKIDIRITLALNVIKQQIEHAKLVTDQFTVSVIDSVFYSHVMNCMKLIK